MDTVRVDIEYRPLRIGWVIRPDDIEGFRRAVRMSMGLWGGIYNPVLLVDEPASSGVVDVFRPDFLYPLGAHPDIEAFLTRFEYLANPLLPSSIFTGGGDREPRSQILDVQNLIHHYRDRPEWLSLKEVGLRVPTWQPDDPLGDVLLAQYGQYLDPADGGPDYAAALSEEMMVVAVPTAQSESLSPVLLDFPGLAEISRFGTQYSSKRGISGGGWRYPGIYLGDGSSIIDLVGF